MKYEETQKGQFFILPLFFLNTIIMISHSLDFAFVLLYFFFYFSLFWRYCPIIISSQQQFIIFFFFILKVKGRNLIDDKDTITNPDHYNNIRTSREAATILQTRQLCKIIIIITSRKPVLCTGTYLFVWQTKK